ncbi:hypothetical protein B0H21DRAFT_758868 [Amylocystis lapponica]|nr:hypothetical protein B0H21DRAFT_758868 [Amylocystis lapponica]
MTRSSSARSQTVGSAPRIASHSRHIGRTYGRTNTRRCAFVRFVNASIIGLLPLQTGLMPGCRQTTSILRRCERSNAFMSLMAWWGLPPSGKRTQRWVSALKIVSGYIVLMCCASCPQEGSTMRGRFLAGHKFRQDRESLVVIGNVDGAPDDCAHPCMEVATNEGESLGEPDRLFVHVVLMWPGEHVDNVEEYVFEERQWQDGICFLDLLVCKVGGLADLLSWRETELWRHTSVER